jgi:hypothetical protein
MPNVYKIILLANVLLHTAQHIRIQSFEGLVLLFIFN